MMGSSVQSSRPLDDTNKCSSPPTAKPTSKTVAGPPIDSADTRGGSSAQEPPDAPASLLGLRVLLGLSFLRTLHAHNAVPSPANSRPERGGAHLPFSSGATNGNSSRAARAHPRRPAPFATSDNQPSAVNPSHPATDSDLNGGAAANPQRTPALPMKLSMLLQEPPGAPTSLLCLLLELSLVKMQRLRPHTAVSSEVNDNQPGVAHSQYSHAPVADENPCGAIYLLHLAPSATNSSQPSAENPRQPTIDSALNGNQPGAAYPRRTAAAALAMKLFMLVCSRRRTPQVSEERTPPPLPPFTMPLNGIRHQVFLGIPLMLAVHKISNIWARFGCGAVLSYLIISTSRGATIFRSFSIRLAEGGFAARLCSLALGRFGYERLPFVSIAEFIDLVSTFFRHTGSALKSASDILKKVNEYCTANRPQPHVRLEGRPSTDESNEASRSQETIGTVSEGECMIISSVSEGRAFISKWKGGSNQISVDVPPNMSLETATELKGLFESEGAKHMLEGAIINSILQDGFVSAKREFERAAKKLKRFRDSMFLHHHQPVDSSFDGWWDKASLAVSRDAWKGLNSLIILGAWTIWKHRNDCVFNGASPSLSTALTLARDEARLWAMAGARGLG